jgi:hypothetical protein
MHGKIAWIFTLVLLGGFPAEQTKQPQGWNAKNIEWQKINPMERSGRCSKDEAMSGGSLHLRRIHSRGIP